MTFSPAPPQRVWPQKLSTLKFCGLKGKRYLNPEQLGERFESRRAIFDVYCENDKGDKFIVEMQNVYQEFFKDRTIYYSTFANAHLFSARQSKASFDCSRLSKSFPIREQAERGDWDYHLNGVYTVGLLNYIFDDVADDVVDTAMPWHHEVKLMDIDRHTVFYDKLTYIYEEIPKFNKTEEELVTMFDKWMYVLRNLSRLMERPAALQERVFTRLFEQAEIARFNPEELKLYEDNLKAYRDIDNAIKTAEKEKFAEGRAEGLAEGEKKKALDVAKRMKVMGMTAGQIAQATGLTPQEAAQI